MPTFFARSTTIQLSAADVRTTTTTDPIIGWSNDFYKDVDRTISEIANASKDGTLAETPLLDPINGSHMRFLGPHGDMPFFMVHAGKTFFDADTNEKRNQKPARAFYQQSSQAPITPASPTLHSSEAMSGVNHEIAANTAQTEDLDRYQIIIDEHRGNRYAPPQVPHALCLTVYLSRNTFLRGEKSKRLIFHDLKITVFFNGELCASTYIPDRYRADSFRMTEHIIRFTGRRVDRLVEKPWVIVPPGQEPNGGLRKLKTNETGHVGAKQRWNSISESLVAESDRLERNERGEHSILGEYISALAQLKMPSDVKDIQKVGGQKFGVIDVVITSGKGHKDDSSNQYLTEPTALRLSHHKLASHQHIGLDKKVKTPIKQYFEIPGINSFGQPTDVIPAQPEEVYLEKPKRVSYQTNSRADADSLAQCFAYDEPRSRAGSAPSIAEKDETSINEPKQLKDSNDPARKFSGLSISHNTQRAVSHSVDNELKEGLSTKTPKEDDCSSTINELKFLVKLSRRTRKAVDTHPSSGSKLLYVNKRSRSPSLPRRSMSVTSSISEKPYVTSFPRVHATHGGPERISSSVQTNFGPKNKRKFSQDKTKQPKTSRARLQYTTVLDNKMTLAEEIASITAEAEKGKTMPISGKYPRLTRSALAKTETEAIFPDAPVNHAASEQENTDDSEANKPPKKIIKLSIPSLKYHIPPEKLASSSPTMAPLTPTIGHVCLPSPISDSQPISSASQAHHAAGPAPSHENWKKIFGPGSLSDDSVLTYAPHGVLRPVRAERSGWFEETGVVMGVRFLVG